MLGNNRLRVAVKKKQLLVCTRARVCMCVYYMLVRDTLECQKRASDPQQPWLQVAESCLSYPGNWIQVLWKSYSGWSLSLALKWVFNKSCKLSRMVLMKGEYFSYHTKIERVPRIFKGQGSVTVEIVMDMWQSGSLSPLFPFQPNKCLQETSPSLSYSSWVIINRESLGLRAPQELKVYP